MHPEVDCPDICKMKEGIIAELSNSKYVETGIGKKHSANSKNLSKKIQRRKAVMANIKCGEPNKQKWKNLISDIVYDLSKK